MILINQPFGIGDVIFSMSAIRAFAAAQKQRVMWPIMPYYVDGLNLAYPDIFFCDMGHTKFDYERKDRYKLSDTEVIPLRWQDSPLRECMKNKYRYFGFDWKDWKVNAHFERNPEREGWLLDLVGGYDSFNLISASFGNNFIDRLPSPHSADFQFPQNGLKNIEMRMIPGFSLFDWSAVIERATTIHVVSSSCIYLFELLKLKAKEIHIHVRRPFERNHENYDYILQSHNYIFHP